MQAATRATGPIGTAAPQPEPAQPVPAAGGGRAFMLRYGLLVAADLTAKVLAYIVTLVVIRYFGAAGYGAFAFAAAVVTCATTAGTFGLDLYGMREAARHPERLRVTIPTVATLRLILAATAYGVLIITVGVVPSFQAVSPLLIILGLSLFTGSVSLNWIAEGLQCAPVLALANVGTQVLFLTLLFGFATWHDVVWVVAAAQVLAELIVAAGVFVWARARFPGGWKPAPRAQWRSVLVESAPMGGTRVLRAVTLASDLAILGFFLPLTEVGWYGGAFRLYLLFLASVGLYSILLFARLARCAAAGESAVWHEVRASFFRILPPAIAATLTAAAAAQWLLMTLFDPTFAAATDSLRLLLLALLVSLVSGHYRLALLAQGRQGRDAFVVGLATLVHIVLKLALIPSLGITGAALGHLLGELALLGMAWYVVRIGSGSQHRRDAG